MKLIYKIKRFRSISNEIDFTLLSTKLNIILGINGSGKSNILDAIKWFSGNKLIDDNNIKTLKTEHHPDYNLLNLTLDDTEILFYDDLDSSEVEKIKKKLEQIGINLEKEELSRNFRRYKDSFYLDYHVSEGKLTDIAYIKNLIYSTFSELWPTGIFVEEEYEGIKYWTINEKQENVIHEITVSTRKGLTQLNRQKLILAIKELFEIESIFKMRPNIISSNNLEADNNILFEYPLLSIKENNIDPTFKKILDMIGKDTKKDLEAIIDLSTGTDSNRTTIRSLKDSFSIKSKKCFKEIFKSFSLSIIPDVLIDDQKFQIVMRGTDERHFINNQPKSQSSGYKSFLWLIIMLEVLKGWNKTKYGSSILVIDEPDKSLHILLQKELATYLKENLIKINSNAFIFFTTHSPFIIPDLNENIYIAEISKEGTTSLIPAKDINNIRNATIFPLISLYHMNKLKEELYPEIKDTNAIRVYYESLDNEEDIKKIKDYLNEVLGVKFNFELISLHSTESEQIRNIRSDSFFSFHVSEANELHEMLLKDVETCNKDIFLTKKFISSLLKDDIL